MKSETPAAPGGKRVAAYLRVSSTEQLNGYGLDVQEAECRKFIELKGWRLVDIYRDEGVSGTLAKRPQFDRLMSDVRAGLIDAVVVHRFDRLARSMATFYRLAEQLKELGSGWRRPARTSTPPRRPVRPCWACWPASPRSSTG